VIESLGGVFLDVGLVPHVFLQAGESSLVVIITAIVGAIAILLRAASTHFDPSQDDDEESEVEIATGDSGGGGSHQHSLKDTVTAEITADPGAGDFKVSRGPINESHGRGNKVKSVSKRSATQCSHCGAVNKESGGLCWNCGSNPDTALKEDALSTINERLRKSSATDSYVVRKDEEPREHPVETAATPQGEDEFEDSDGTTEEDIRRKQQERPPIWRVWVGEFLGWLRKWRMLVNIHARSMLLVTLIAAVIWGIGLVYGAARFGVSGFVSLFGASIIAVLSASVAVLFFLVPGKRKTIGLAYPFTLNVVLLPPLIIAYYEPVLAFVWDYSSNLAIWILDTPLDYYGINSYLRQNFTMTRGLYILMWFILSYPAGWIVGSSVYGSKIYGPKLRAKLKEVFSSGSKNTFDAVPDDTDTESPSNRSEKQ
jgi:hypothetical protein